MQRTVIALVALTALSGCMNADDIRQRPAVWTATFAAPYDTMANCVAANSFAILMTATPMIDTRSKRAEVLVSHSLYGYMMGQFDFRETADGKTEVSYRDWLRQGRQDYANNPVMNKCGGGPPLPAT